MVYKISDTAMIIESDGKAILIADEVQYAKGGLTIGSTVNDLDENYFTTYFAPPYSFQGSTSGYTSGGQRTDPPTYIGSNVIDKFPFASDGNATDVGDLSENYVQRQTSGSSSSSNGYVAGGEGTFLYSPSGARTDRIDKFPFSADGNASDIANLAAAVSYAGGNSSSTHGYCTGGSLNPSPPGPPYTRNEDAIQKYSFSSDGNASDVANLLAANTRHGGQSSPTHGYAAGGGTAPSGLNVIQKFTFASDANATDVGDLLSNNYYPFGGNSSLTHGYVEGGPNNLNVIQKFPFSSDTNASDVGDLSQGRNSGTGQNSGSSGYVSGGLTFPPYVAVNTIEKFPFSADTNAADVGDLTLGRNNMAGQQV